MGVEHHGEPERDDEDGLVRAAQGGQREAFARLYETHVERVYRYLMSRLGQPADAEDVTAEVFIRAMKALPSYKIRETPLIAWLYRIAHNEAINYLKKRARRGETTMEEVIDISDDPADEALSRVSFREASLAMEGLTELQRQVLSLRFGGELSIAETAKIMKRREGAVKFLQHSALRALRTELEQRGASSHGG